MKRTLSLILSLLMVFSLFSGLSFSASAGETLETLEVEEPAAFSLVRGKNLAATGAEAFEQCAGFLRVPESRNPLDNTGVHPESYAPAKELLKLVGYSDQEIKEAKFSDISARVKQFGTKALAEQLGIGLPTLDDIVEELTKPGRDPRDEMPQPMLRTDVLSIENLKEGMELTGTVRNVIDFGLFDHLSKKDRRR